MYRIIGADGKEYGPVSLDQILQWIQEGRANNETRVLSEGASEWRPLGSLPEFAPPGATPPGAPFTPQPFPVSAPRRSHPLAIAGLVIGIISLTIGFCCCYGLPMNLIGLVLSIVAWTQIRNQPDIYSGPGLAIAGTILNGLSVLIAVGLMATFGVRAIMETLRTHHF